MKSAKPIKAVFVRHPESTGNAQKLTKGTKEYELDSKGKRESKALGLRIARFRPTVVITSPLKRAIEPAREIAERAGVPLKVDHDLLPQDFGDIEGTPRETGEPKVRDAAMNHPSKPMPGGESFNAWDKKNTSAMRRVKVMMSKGERPAVVTHSRNLRELPHALFGEKKADPTKGGPEPAGYTTLSRSMKLKIHAPVRAQA